MMPSERDVADFVLPIHGLHNSSSTFLASLIATISSKVCAECDCLSTDAEDVFSLWNLVRASAAYSVAIGRDLSTCRRKRAPRHTMAPRDIDLLLT